MPDLDLFCQPGWAEAPVTFLRFSYAVCSFCLISLCLDVLLVTDVCNF